ncbi:MAG: hypothetical protein IKY10_01195, partial [Clostridia bacterium]|nr:hypothetical protein [Clostridia bacterium]
GGAIYASDNVVIADGKGTIFNPNGVKTGLSVDWTKDFTIETTFMSIAYAEQILFSSGDMGSNTVFAMDAYGSNLSIYTVQYYGIRLDIGTIPLNTELKLTFNYLSATQGINFNVVNLETNTEIISQTYDYYDTEIYGDRISEDLYVGGDFRDTGIGNIGACPSIIKSFNYTSGEDSYVFNSQNLGNSGKVVFNGNVAESSGGAIFAGKYVAIAKDAEFKDNESRAGDGGAIYGYGVTLCGDMLFANNKNLNENDTERKGGAICALGGAYSPRGNGVDINGNVTFSNNYSGCEGGAIHTDNDVTISGETVFRNNSARYAGGAIRAAYAVTISGKTQFIENDGGVNFGGAIYTSNGNVILSDVVEFRDNQINGSGGAICVRGTGYKVEILGEALFENNEAGAAGGAIYTAGNLTIGGETKFINNKCTNEGAVAYVGKNLVITEEVMLKNNSSFQASPVPPEATDLKVSGDITLGADILWATNDSSRIALWIESSKWIKVTGQLTKRIPVYKNGATRFTGSNVNSYIFEDQTTEGLQDCGKRFPFECVNNDYEYEVNYNNSKAKYGVLLVGAGNGDFLEVGSLALDLGADSTGSFTYGTDKDLIQYFTIISTNPSVVQVVDYESYVSDGSATCNLKTIAPGTAQIIIQGGYNEGEVEDEVIVYVTVTLKDSGVEIGDMPSGLQYSQTSTISYKAATAGTFEIISLNSVAEVLSYSEHVVANNNYSAFIKATGVGDAEIMFKFTPDSEYYASEEATYTFSIEQYVLPEVSNVRFLQNSYNGAYSILTWDSLSTSDINVRYEFAVRDSDFAYSDCIYYSSTNKIDIYDYLMNCAQEIVSNDAECDIMIEFINAYADNCLSSNTPCSYVSIHFNYISIDCSAIKDKVSAIKIDGKTYKVTDDDNRFNLYFFEGQTSEIELILTGEAISDSYIIDEWAGVTNTKINSTTTSVRYIGGDSFAGRLTPT